MGDWKPLKTGGEFSRSEKKHGKVTRPESNSRQSDYRFPKWGAWSWAERCAM